MVEGPEHRSRIPPAKLLEVCLLIILCALIPLLYINLSISVLDDLAGGEWGGADFTAYYTAARLVTLGRSPYDATAFGQEAECLGFREDRPYIYLPPLAIAITPLTLLSPRQATVAWFWMSFVLLIASTILTLRLLGLQSNRIYAVALLIGALAFYPATFSIFMGQTNALILALIALAAYLSTRRCERLAGIALGCATLIKIFPFCVALYFLWKSKYRLFLYTIATMVILAGISIAVVGPDAHWTYINSVLPTQFIKPHALNQSLSGFFARIAPIRQAGGWALWRALSLSVSALLGLATVLIVPRGSRNEQAFDLEVSLVIVTMLLISTVSWIGTLTLLIMPYVVMAKHSIDRLHKGDWHLALLASLSFVLVNSQRVLESSSILSGIGLPTSPWLQALPMYAMILLWLTIAYTLLRHRDTRATQTMAS